MILKDVQGNTESETPQSRNNAEIHQSTLYQNAGKLGGKTYTRKCVDK